MAEPVVQDRTNGAAPPRERGGGVPAGRAPPGADEAARHGVRGMLRRIVLGALTTIVAVNIWTGGPLVALWVGSRVQSAVGQLSMGAVGATVGVLIVETILLYKLLALLSLRYDRVIGREAPRQQTPWLKPMSGERKAIAVKRPLTAIERIVIGSVVVGVLFFEIWFFFFAHYSLSG